MTLAVSGIDVLSAFWNGAFGSSHALFSSTLVRATPLALLGLAVSVAFRAGVLNIGADGQFLVGAAAASMVALATDSLSGAFVVPAMLVAGAAGGLVWASIAAVMRRYAGVLEVISTLLLNFVALSLLSWMVRGPLQEPTGAFPATRTFAVAAHWPFLINGQRLHLGFLLAVVAAGAVQWTLSSTVLGMRVRAVGAGAAAAASAGHIDVKRTVFGAFLASGALAGAAGAAEIGGVTHALYEGISPGYGYTAIAVALLARLDARWIIPSAIFFGALQAGADGMQREAGVPAALATVLVAFLILAALGAPHLMRLRRSGVAVISS